MLSTLSLLNVHAPEWISVFHLRCFQPHVIEYATRSVLPNKKSSQHIKRSLKVRSSRIGFYVLDENWLLCNSLAFFLQISRWQPLLQASHPWVTTFKPGSKHRFFLSFLKSGSKPFPKGPISNVSSVPFTIVSKAHALASSLAQEMNALCVQSLSCTAGSSSQEVS